MHHYCTPSYTWGCHHPLTNAKVRRKGAVWYTTFGQALGQKEPHHWCLLKFIVCVGNSFYLICKWAQYIWHFQIFKDFENTWTSDFVNGCMQYTKQFTLVFEKAFKNIGMWWGHVVSCVLIVIIVLWWGHIALSSHITCTSSQCFAWTTPILFFYSNLQNVIAHYVMVIFEIFRRIGVLYGTCFSGFQ
jgi:hypothetical protein